MSAIRVSSARTMAAKPLSSRSVAPVSRRALLVQAKASDRSFVERAVEAGQKVVPVVAAVCLMSLPMASPSQAFGWWNQKSIALDAAKGIDQKIDTNTNDNKTTGNKILDAVRETEKAYVPQNTSQTGSKVQDIGMTEPSKVASKEEKKSKFEEQARLADQPFTQSKPGSNKTPKTP